MNLATVLRELGSLKRRVEKLEGWLADETFTPTFQTITPGSLLVGANFTGVVNALGLVIPTFAGVQGLQGSANSIEWQDSTLFNFVTAQIYGANFGPGNESWLGLQAGPIGSLPFSVVDLLAFANQGGQTKTDVQIQAKGGASSTANNFVQIVIGTVTLPTTYTVIDGAGNSSFVQLQSSHQTILDHNNGSFYSLNFSVAANNVQTLTFSTLRSSWSAAIPFGILSAQSNSPMTWEQGSFTAPNTFSITAINNSAAAATCTWTGMVVGR